MIKYEYNTLVLDASHTKDDQKAVNDFVEYVTLRERERVLKLIISEGIPKDNNHPLYNKQP
jgi:hypothetical protein